MDDSKVLSTINELEKRRSELIRLQAAMQDVTVLMGKREFLRKEYEALKSRLLQLNLKSGETCPTCRQPISDKALKYLNEYASRANAEIREQIDIIIKQGKELSRQIEEAGKQATDGQDPYSEEIAAADVELKRLRQQQQTILETRAKAAVQNELALKSAGSIDEIVNRLNAIKASKSEINKAVKAVTLCNSIRAEAQFKNISGYLNKVSIRLEKMVKSTGELKDCFEVLYDNKEMMLLSNSERIRAALEISNMINSRTGLKLPVFIDNAESITHYDKPDTQVFEAVVARNRPLSVYDSTL